jgi:Protein of unknown function (DUF3179)
MKRILLPALWAVALVSATVVLVPVFLLKPFSPQTARAVAIAYQLREAAPVVSLVCAALVLGGALVAWRGRRIWTRVALVGSLVVAGGAFWLARQNHFEWMFNPLKNPAYASGTEAAAFVDPADMVIAVELRGDAVAYPVRQMAYHHVVNDQVGGVPIVSTY